MLTPPQASATSSAATPRSLQGQERVRKHRVLTRGSPSITSTIADAVVLKDGDLFQHARLPELFTGFSRAEYSVPIRYPVACHPQAWAAGSIPFFLQILFGLEADGFAPRLQVNRPSLPERWSTGPSSASPL
jgi:hypothetical protein